jgi:hypothetical protein
MFKQPGTLGCYKSSNRNYSLINGAGSLEPATAREAYDWREAMEGHDLGDDIDHAHAIGLHKVYTLYLSA